MSEKTTDRIGNFWRGRLKPYYSPNNEGGFLILYILILIAGFLLIASSVMPSLINMQRVDQAKKTAVEVSLIQDAALLRKKETGAHSSSIDQLKSEGRIPPSHSYVNPWGNDYRLDTSTGQVVVTTILPCSVSNVLVTLLPNASVDNAGNNNCEISSNALSP